MKKVIAFIGVLVFIAVFTLSCQKVEGPRERRELTEAEKARCKELWEGRPDKDYTKEEERYLREVCRIPWGHEPDELVNIMTWWRDEDDHWEMMYYKIDLIMNLRQTWRPEVIDALKRIALESRYVQLRERATIALHKIDRKKYLPIIKEVLRKEVEEWGVTPESRKTVIYWAGRILSEEGEYEYAFPYLMKAKVFRISVKRRDRRAIPYMYEALKDKDDYVRIHAASGLSEMGEKNDEIFNTVIEFIEHEEKGHLALAIIVLGELGDERGLPILERLVKKNIPYISDEAKRAIKVIESRRDK